jgi:hypothetical protein
MIKSRNKVICGQCKGQKGTFWFDEFLDEIPDGGIKMTLYITPLRRANRHRWADRWQQDEDMPDMMQGQIFFPVDVIAEHVDTGHEVVRSRRQIGEQVVVGELVGAGRALFFSDQLLPWAPMFARAAFAATTEPVLRFAALVLEQFMKCESTVLVTAKRRS